MASVPRFRITFLAFGIVSMDTTRRLRIDNTCTEEAGSTNHFMCKNNIDIITSTTDDSDQGL